MRKWEEGGPCGGRRCKDRGALGARKGEGPGRGGTGGLRH